MRKTMERGTVCIHCRRDVKDITICCTFVNNSDGTYDRLECRDCCPEHCGKPSKTKLRKDVKEAGLFVHGRAGHDLNPSLPETATFCSDCIPEALLSWLGHDSVDIWEEGSQGWTKAPVCDSCRLSLPVYLTGR